MTVRTTTVFRQELGTGGRVAFALLGVIVFALGLYLLLSGILNGNNAGNGYFNVPLLDWLVIIALFLIGVLNLVSAATRAEGASTSHRGVRAAIGVIVIVLGIFALLSVAFNTTVLGVTPATLLWVLVGAAFTLEGIFLIVVGLVPTLESWHRGVAIALGAIVLVFGILTWIYPTIGVFVVWIILSVALLAFGIRYILVGVSGIRIHKLSMETST